MKFQLFPSILFLSLLCTFPVYAQTQETLNYISSEQSLQAHQEENMQEASEESHTVTWPKRINLFFPNTKSIQYVDLEDPQTRLDLFEQIPQNKMQFGGMTMFIDMNHDPSMLKEPFKMHRYYKEEATPTSVLIWLEENNLLPAAPPNIPEVVEIIQKEDGTIGFSGAPIDYTIIDIPKLTSLINGSKGQEIANITVPLTAIKPKLKIDEVLQERGIKEVIGIGHSDFVHSSESRVTNIYAAMAQIHGAIIAQGEEFSFNETLEDVSPEKGFVPELVIIGDKLEKEFGGGTCQVSTTVYRGAIETGLPITKRRNHSFVIPYYGEVGLDATIYLGGQDLMFANDTPGDILIQQYAYGTQLYTIIYGTNDGRKVELEGPYKYNYRAIPAPNYETVSWLAPGKKYYKEGGKTGLDARWVRKIIKHAGTENEEIIEEDIYSRYRAKPARILIGADPNAIPESPSQDTQLSYVSSTGESIAAQQVYGPTY